MNIERIEEILKEIRRKEKKINKLLEQKIMVELEKSELHEELAKLVKTEEKPSLDVNDSYKEKTEEDKTEINDEN